jgi:hypothetical protein
MSRRRLPKEVIERYYPHLGALVRPDIAGMSQPARCTHCDGIYDLGTVEVTARYADCSMWKSPCCGLTVDDRGETGWKSSKDYERLQRGAR